MTGRAASLSRWVPVALAAVAAAAASGLLGAQAAGPEPYKARTTVGGTIRLWGHGSPTTHFMGALVKEWEDGFRRHHPGVRFEDRMYGTASAIPALYTGTGDVAILGREIRPFEVAAFERVKGYPPLGVDVATGSLDVRNFDFALVVFVNADNPVSSLSLEQLDAVFGCEHRRARASARTWGQLGLKGEWAGRAVHTYGSRLSGGFAIFFQDVVMKGSGRWNPDLAEFFDVRQPDGKLLDSGQQVLDAVGRDRDGIGIASLLYRNPRVKPLALAWNAGEAPFAATRENLVERRYPLTRFIPAYLDRRPGEPPNPAAAEFLRYILSAEGQDAIVRDGRYLPLGAAAIREQLAKLR